MADEKAPRRASKVDREAILLANINKWIESGDTPEQALERLTMAQYDFLIERGIDFDNLILTPEQQANIKAVTRAPRTCKPSGYDKKYPPDKREFYEKLTEFVTSLGGEIIPREKQNYRDLDFTINGKHRRIVVSDPRPKN